MRSSPSRRAFTLVEMLLVLVLIGIISAAIIPNLSRSIRGNRLRLAVRMVVMAGRYARSMAVLKQRDILLEFDLDKSAFTVKEVEVRHNDSNTAGIAANASPPAVDGEEDEPPPVRVVTKELLERTLDRVTINVVSANDKEARDGKISVIFYSNGRCDPYTVELEDERGKVVEIEVDALATAQTRGL